MSGALGDLAAALAQTKRGMQRIPFPLESYQTDPPLSAKRILNYYAEQEPADSRTPVALIPTPDLTLYANYGPGPIWDMNGDEPGRLYIASGTNFYRVSASNTGILTENLGSIGAPATDVLVPYARFISIAVGPTAVVVCVPPNAYTCDHFGALNKIGGTFPGAAAVSYLDGYFVFTDYADNARFFISGLLNPTAFNALDFAFSDGLPNVLRRAVPHRGEIWLMGDGGIEVWYDSGDVSFPFRRQSGGVIPFPVAAPKSIATGDSSVFWAGRDGIIYRSNGYSAIRISTHALEAFVQANDPSGIVSGMVYTHNGHIFYSFTQAGRTFSYDCATKLWADRASGSNGTGRWLPGVSALFIDLHLLGDSSSGNVYMIGGSTGFENGIAVKRSVTMPPLWAGTNRAFCNRLEIEMSVGTATSSPVLLEWSDDGGITWIGSRTLSTGTIGQYRKRVVANRLGSFHQRVFRLTTNGYASLYAVDADITFPRAGG